MTFNGPETSTFEQRRRDVLSRLAAMKAVLFLPGAPEAIYSNDVHYRYRPATNIRYLTGFEEPAALILSGAKGEPHPFVLLVQPRDDASETWTGRRAGIEGAVETYGADQAHALTEWPEHLETALKDAERFYCGHSLDPRQNERVIEIVHRVNAARQRGGGTALVVTEAGALIDDIRLIKSQPEIEVLRTACSVSAAAHRRMMEMIAPGMYEYHVEAEIERDFRVAGCSGPAYGTIAAAGVNATILHYTRNTTRLVDGELLLIDAGGEYGGYCADITRTLPVGAAYSPAQAELYDLVLAAQVAAVETVAPGVLYTAVHDAAVRVLVRGMLDLGILRGEENECIESCAYKAFFMHGTSHWLGMDVHDVGSYRVGEESRSLEPGIVLTVEPGIYVRADAEVPERFRGIGIRIEDDVVVTPTGREVLTAGAPKDRREIETLRTTALGR